jgi:hypothetical protein
MYSVFLKKNLQFVLSIIFFCCIVNNTILKAATTLAAGDIVFTGYNSAGTTASSDTLTFVLLKNLDANTVINFTDRGFGAAGFNSDNGTSETSISWNIGQFPLTVGTEICIFGLNSKTVKGWNSVGTVTAITGVNGLSLTSSDQIIAYQGSIGTSFTLIAGIHWNNCFNGTSASSWDAVSCTGNGASAMPPGLVNGTSAMWAGVASGLAWTAAKFNCATPFSTVLAMRSAILNSANWSSVTSSSTPFGVRNGCTYSIVAFPVKIVRFYSQTPEGYTVLNWEIAEAINVSHFEVERSLDARAFSRVGQQPYRGGVSFYSFADFSDYLASNSTRLYYRLKLVDTDGSTAYSKTISVLTNKDGKAITAIAYPNPFQSNLTVLVPGEKGHAKVEVLNSVGKVILKRNVQIKDNFFELDLYHYAPAGHYLLNVSGESFQHTVKIVKE